MRCFYCDMGLRHWEPGDDPWEEHARWYPRCNYMITTKGEEYIRQIQDKYNQVSESRLTYMYNLLVSEFLNKNVHRPVDNEK